MKNFAEEVLKILSMERKDVKKELEKKGFLSDDIDKLGADNRLHYTLLEIAANSEIEDDCRKATLSKSKLDNIKLVERTLAKIGKDSTRSEIFGKVCFRDGYGYMTNTYWMLKTEKRKLDGLKSEYILSEEKNCDYLDCNRVIPSVTPAVSYTLTYGEVAAAVKKTKGTDLHVMRIKTDKFEIGFNCKYMEFIFKYWKVDEITFDMFKPLSPVVAKNGNDIFVLCPVHLAEVSEKVT